MNGLCKIYKGKITIVQVDYELGFYCEENVMVLFLLLHVEFSMASW